MQIVYTDLAGPITPSTIPEDHYLEKFKQYLAEMQIAGKKLETLRSDNGRESISDEFKTFCRNQGIRREHNPRTKWTS